MSLLMGFMIKNHPLAALTDITGEFIRRIPILE
ncbi:hypothetical protein ABENE_11030 [Asticcacaulis benevestitus DSM 16100 = ATCC BAA-896]|uniref:Uncharacterized protein n=1 Tax=Asticcacaulis benevestitus DSM 16100 = ATCC BAA-896 TaxID=1121022 RepID=V4PRN6_9CAUL|nr:hypothetical protein ABENE_11030 [Asticcacaulis benevestitus DSM 16100 = ATCC BAA-896]